MKRHVLVYGLIGGVLIVVLKLIEYRFLVIEHSIDIYGGLVAASFAGLGIWLGLRLTGKQRARIVVKEVAVPASAPAEKMFVVDDTKREELGITRRELEILELIGQGLSNREIAEKLYVSENTVKTHSSRVFDKLEGPGDGRKRCSSARNSGCYPELVTRMNDFSFRQRKSPKRMTTEAPPGRVKCVSIPVLGYHVANFFACRY
jgi:hypothetical protein